MDFKLCNMDTLDNLSPETISYLRQALVPFEPYKVVLCRNINLKLICSTVIFRMNWHESVMDLEISFQCIKRQILSHRVNWPDFFNIF